MKEFTITLDTLGDIPLHFTADVSKKISGVFGGFVPAYNKIVALEPDAFVQLILAGAGKGPAEITKLLPEYERDVYETGLLTLQSRLLEFLNLLAGGAKNRDAAGYSA